MAENPFLKYRPNTVLSSPTDPTAAAEEARRQQDQQFEAQRLANEEARLRIAEQQAAINAALGQVNIQQGQQGLAEAAQERSEAETIEGQRNIRQRLRMGNILENVRRARELAEQGGTGWESLLSTVPASQARELAAALRPIQATLAFDRLQEMREESKTGGALGAISERELDLLQGAVAALDPGVSRGSFLDSLDQIERHFVGSQLALSGIDPDSDEGVQVFQNYGVDVPVGGQALNQRQQRVMDAVLEANPSATPEQLSSIFSAAGIPEVANLEEIVAARQQGAGVAPASEATYQESLLGQGVSGVNEGLAGLLGLPVDATTFAMNLIPQGINAIANTNIPTIENPALGGDWWRNQMEGWGIYNPTDDPTAQFTRRVGESVGASAIPIGAAANTGRQAIAGLLAATGGGIGGATAQQVAPGNVGAEIAAELLGGGLAGGSLAMAGRRAAQREIESAIPTTSDLREQAGDLYRQAEASGVSAGPDDTTRLAESFRETLRRRGQLGPEGRITDADSNTTKALNLVEQYEGRPMTPVEMGVVRQVIGEGRMSADAADRRIAGLLTEEFDNWARPMSPIFDDARSVASRQLNAQELESAREKALTFNNPEAALRNQYRQFDRSDINNRAFYPEPVLDAIQNVSRGTPGTRALDRVARLAPSGSSPITLTNLSGTGTGAALGGLAGGPIGSFFGAAVGPAIGAAARSASNRMTQRGADIAELTARAGAPLEQAPLVTDDTQRLIAAILAGQMAGIN